MKFNVKFIEKHIISNLLLFCAIRLVAEIYRYPVRDFLADLCFPNTSFAGVRESVSCWQMLLVIVFSILASVLLKRNEKPKAELVLDTGSQTDTVSNITLLATIPFLSTFWMTGIGFLDMIPDNLNPMLFISQSIELALFAIAIEIIGLIVSLWGLLSIRKSFGVIIQARTSIFGGAYRYFRHPMYSGYMIFNCGFILLNPKVTYLVYCLIGNLLFVIRAILEEKILKEADPEYGEYMQRVKRFGIV